MEMKSSNYIIQVMDLNVNGDYKTKYQQILFEAKVYDLIKLAGRAGLVIICLWSVRIATVGGGRYDMLILE